MNPPVHLGHFDFIGDIHGHANELKELLVKLDYLEQDGAFQHPERTVVFLGDFIDRGPQIPETLRLVESMINQGSAQAVMGNHEYNAICYHTEKEGGGHLREHTVDNQKQHAETLRQFSEPELLDWVEWFKKLPLFLELPGARVIHAQWSEEHIKAIGGRRHLDDELLHKSAMKGTAEYVAVEVLLKGTELPLPKGEFFKDKDGHIRTQVRVKWWMSGIGKTYRELCFPESEKTPDTLIPLETASRLKNYSIHSPPVFIGHYWLKSVLPTPVSRNVACLDYSVAKQGMLVAYRWDGEQALDAGKFVWVPASDHCS